MDDTACYSGILFVRDSVCDTPPLNRILPLKTKKGYAVAAHITKMGRNSFKSELLRFSSTRGAKLGARRRLHRETTVRTLWKEWAKAARPTCAVWEELEKTRPLKE